MSTNNEEEEYEFTSSDQLFMRFTDPEKEKEHFRRLRTDPTYKPEVIDYTTPEMVALRKRLDAEAAAKLEAYNAKRNKGMTPEEIEARDQAEWEEIDRHSTLLAEAHVAKLKQKWRDEEEAERRKAVGGDEQGPAP